MPRLEPVNSNASYYLELDLCLVIIIIIIISLNSDKTPSCTVWQYQQHWFCTQGRFNNV